MGKNYRSFLICLSFFCVSVFSVNATETEAELSLSSYSSGSFVVQKPDEYSEGWSGFWMLDEKPDTGWASPEGKTKDNVMVIELAEKSVIKRFEFDTGKIDGPGRGAKDVIIEISDSGPEKGFKKIGEYVLQDQADMQKFTVTAEIPGRWLRLTIRNNHGAEDYTELMEFRGYGSQLTKTPFPEASGTYNSDYGDFHLRQQGTSVSGCYEHNNGLLNGGIEGRIMKFTWTEEDKNGPAIVVFSGDGKKFFGLWWYEGEEAGNGSFWSGSLNTRNIGGCPNWSGGAQEQMARELAKSGRVRVYGINFNVDSSVIRDESKQTLDGIVSMLKADASMKLIIEGHTDSSGSDEHNKALSQKRAESVKAYLEAGGIAGDRLTATGIGSSKPVAPNTNALGKAQNRRVELVKK